MATSSILTNVVIRETIEVEKFIEALEASSHDPEWKPTAPSIPLLTDIDEIRRLMMNRGEK